MNDGGREEKEEWTSPVCLFPLLVILLRQVDVHVGSLNIFVCWSSR